MPRAPPCRHRVSGYTRKDGTKVPPYYRGQGTRRKQPRRGNTIDADFVNQIKDDDGGGGEWEHYTITLIYDNDAVETMPIMARDADDALNLALAERKNKKNKVKTSIVQDGIGDVVRKLAKGINAKKAEFELMEEQGKIKREQLRNRIKRIQTAPERFRKSLIDSAEEGEIETLVKAGQNTRKKTKARAARRMLKRKYPVVYNSIAWTRV